MWIEKKIEMLIEKKLEMWIEKKIEKIDKKIYILTARAKQATAAKDFILICFVLLRRG